MVLAVVLVQFLYELLTVVVNGVRTEHLEAEYVLVKAHLVEELSEDDTKWAQCMTFILAELISISLKHIFVHLKYHPLILFVFC